LRARKKGCSQKAIAIQLFSSEGYIIFRFPGNISTCKKDTVYNLKIVCPKNTKPILISEEKGRKATEMLY